MINKLLLATIYLLLFGIAAADSKLPIVLEKVAVDRVWPGHPVGFALLTHGDRQFVAYYDADRRMMVATRDTGQTDWSRAVLPETLNWDSHNYVTLALDRKGVLHLSGNMHCVPLVYFRTTKPLDINTFERAPMTGQREDRVTYPVFLHDADNRLIFGYRDGKSGSGDQIYNVYDEKKKSWQRLTDAPLFSGQGRMNAYLQGPVKGPDGRFHLCWVWRDNPGCESNHDVSYARSRDLVHWETAGGEPLTLPITVKCTGTIVDPVPPGGGVINGNTRVGFDRLKRPVVSYHKYDAAGKTQIYNARFENGAWKTYQTSDWDYRWDFSGGGSIKFEIGLSGVSPVEKGALRQSYSHAKLGGGIWRLDEETLKPAGTMEETWSVPEELQTDEGKFPGMIIRRADDLGGTKNGAGLYLLQWETLGPNRDRPREGNLPPPSTLWLIRTGKAK